MALYGVYGSHTVEACPVNNKANAKKLVSLMEGDPKPLLSKYQIKDVLGQYHSAYEHTFLWILDAADPHLIEDFALEAGVVSFNELKIVPLKSLKENIVPKLKKLHNI